MARHKLWIALRESLIAVELWHALACKLSLDLRLRLLRKFPLHCFRDHVCVVRASRLWVNKSNPILWEFRRKRLCQGRLPGETIFIVSAHFAHLSKIPHIILQHRRGVQHVHNNPGAVMNFGVWANALNSELCFWFK